MARAGGEGCAEVQQPNRVTADLKLHQPMQAVKAPAGTSNTVWLWGLRGRGVSRRLATDGNSVNPPARVIGWMHPNFWLEGTRVVAQPTWLIKLQQPIQDRPVHPDLLDADTI
jgi:hypothetical protein